MLESKFEREAIRSLRTLPNSYWPEKVDALSVRGLPDRVGLVNGMYCALEFKKSEAESKKKTGRIVLQRKTLDEIQKAGGYAAIVYPENWYFVYAELKHMSGEVP